MKTVASVVMSNCTRKFDKEYHYVVPESLVAKVAPGIRVIVPFGRSNKSTEAYVLEVLVLENTEGLKEVKEIIDQRPALSGNILKLVSWMKNRYICTYSDVIKTMLPPGTGIKSLAIIKLLGNAPGLKPTEKRIIEFLAENGEECELEEMKKRTAIKGISRYISTLKEKGIIEVYEEFSPAVREKTVRVAYMTLSKEEVIEEIESNRIRRIQHIRVLEILMDNEYVGVQDLARFSGVSASVLNTLKKYGYIDFKEIEVSRDPYNRRCIEKTQPMEPTLEQKQVLDTLQEQMDLGRFHEALLHGVTGSGKTEVYLQLIQHCIKNHKQAIVLVPEISLTPQMVERFKGRFGDDVAVLHSRMSLGERYDQWRLIRDGRIKVTVGARSAIFAPFRKLGIVIIDEEHENSYKSEITPKYHAVDVARERCRIDEALLLCGSATPSVESYYRALQGESQLLEMKLRANHMLLPEVTLVDMRKELDRGNRSIFSKKLAEEMKYNIQEKEQTILFLNRRGYASFVMCRSCGFTLICPDCNVSMTYHAHDDRVICHYCGYTVKSPQSCPKCKSSYIRHFGTGTQKVEEEVRKQFPESSIVRMDMDTTTGKNSHEEILRTFREKNINVMVGTQMIAKGHDFPKVTLVGVMAADSMLNTGDYRASERTFQLITQVAGRAGRGELSGRVVIQSYNTEDFSITSACKHDYDSFYNQEIRLREKLCYPPFTNIAAVVLSGPYDRGVFIRSKEVKGLLESGFSAGGSDADILGPSRAPLSKIKNKYRWRIVIKCKNMDKMIAVLSSVSDEFYDKKGKDTVDLSMDINPVSML